MMREDQATTETIIISSLSTLTPSQLSQLTHAISAHFHRHHHRLSTLLSSPSLFSQTLHHLTLFFPTPPPPSPSLYTLRLHDYDAVLLLLLLCQLHQHNPEAMIKTPQAKWRLVLGRFFLDTILSVSGIGVLNGVVLFQYVELVARCLRFVGTILADGGDHKVGREVAASPAAVVSLPSVEVRGAAMGTECVICREEMREGRDVCELPCQHLFHWMCILPWLRKRNTCPCCRFQLPSDNVFGEIQRLWAVLVDVSASRDL